MAHFLLVSADDTGAKVDYVQSDSDPEVVDELLEEARSISTEVRSQLGH